MTNWEDQGDSMVIAGPEEQEEVYGITEIQQKSSA